MSAISTGDGEYEYVVDRFQAGVSQYVDAYHRDGTFMWRVDMGPNSTNTDLSLSGPDTISCGMPTMKPCMTSTATARPSSY